MSIASLTAAQVTDLTDMFRLLGEPNRLRLVIACLDAPQSVGAMVDALGLSQTLVSHHLRLLRTAHILRGDRDGRQVHYAIDDDHVRAVVRNMIAHLTEPHDHADHDPVEPTGSDPWRDKMATETVNCACKDCVCNIAPEKAVMKDGKAFCCEDCAQGHAHKQGCEHDGCACHG